MHRNLATDAVLADAALYASGARRLTVDHGGPLTAQSAEGLQQLVRLVEETIRALPGQNTVELLVRTRSLTWTSHRPEGSTCPLVLAARTVANQLDPGGWVITADDYSLPSPPAPRSRCGAQRVQGDAPCWSAV